MTNTDGEITAQGIYLRRSFTSKGNLIPASPSSFSLRMYKLEGNRERNRALTIGERYTRGSEWTN